MFNWDDRAANCSVADIGCYVRLEIRKNKQGKWYLYLSIRVWKEDGALIDKLCQHQRVAYLCKDDMGLAKANAEKWYKEFVKTQINACNFSLGELLH